ncbi:MAG TPA: hypothetical protein DDW90_04645 [Cyanobacteria bacterium UBA9971]|nr:hypothetical protein [Cyanobacteria bacterium UBA9971]
MKRIAFIIRLLQKDKFHGGGEKLFFNLIKRFIAANYEIDIYCSKSDINLDSHGVFQTPQNDNDFLDGINKIVVVDEHYDHLKPETMENFYSKVKNLIKIENYDYVISENITPPVDITFLQGHSLLNRLKRDKNPLEAFFYNFRKVKKERMKFHKKWFDEGYRKIFVVSEVLKRDIVENYGILEDKISVIYPGVDIPDEKEQPTKNYHSERPIGAWESHNNTRPCDRFANVRNDNTVIFGLSAPGFKIKGGFILLKALGMLKKKGYDFKAKIVYPKYTKNLGVKLLVKLLNIEKNVEFLSYQQNILEFYQSIDVLVAPSIEDTFNLAVLEAMSNYKPCIISTNAGASEIIKDGENGFVFDIKSNPEKNLAEKMMFCLDNFAEINDISEKSFETAKYYNWQRTFDSFIRELEKLS